MLWDGTGNRVKLETSADPQQVYTYVYDPTAGVPAVIEEVTPTGSVYYVREPNGALIARVVGTAAQHYHFDDLGNTLFITGMSGTISDEYTYDAWGVPTSHTGSTNQPYQYVGQLGYYTHYQDTNMPLLQLGVRFYDAETGRFTQHGSPYTYAGNNPVTIAGAIIVTPPWDPGNRSGDIPDTWYGNIPQDIEACAEKRKAHNLCWKKLGKPGIDDRRCWCEDILSCWKRLRSDAEKDRIFLDLQHYCRCRSLGSWDPDKWYKYCDPRASIRCINTRPIRWH